MPDKKIEASLLVAEAEKKKEWRLFIFIIVFLFPLLTVAVVGAMGFTIWFYQLIVGPPGY
jgi:periplasmic nitrate reductase NapE